MSFDVITEMDLVIPGDLDHACFQSWLFAVFMSFGKMTECTWAKKQFHRKFQMPHKKFQRLIA